MNHFYVTIILLKRYGKNWLSYHFCIGFIIEDNQSFL